MRAHDVVAIASAVLLLGCVGDDPVRGSSGDPRAAEGSGPGASGSMRLSGGIGALARAPAPSAGVLPRAQGFEGAHLTCSGGTCLRGGLEGGGE